jgi:hypothetical protein
MSARDLVLGAFRFEPPDRIPRFDNFWEYPEEWARRLGPAAALSDIRIWVPEEGAFCTRARPLKEEGGWVYEVDPWGRTGGMCNTHTLVNGPASQVEAEARALIDLSQEGGLVIGTHSISPEIPLELYEAYHRTCQTYGHYRQRLAVSPEERRR